MATKKKTKHSAKSLVENMKSLIQKVIKTRSVSSDFIDRVDEQRDGALGYYKKIKRPMYLNQILMKLKKEKYETPLEIHADFKLIGENCRIFTPDPNNKIHMKAGWFDKFFDELWNKNAEALLASGVDVKTAILDYSLGKSNDQNEVTSTKKQGKKGEKELASEGDADFSSGNSEAINEITSTKSPGKNQKKEKQIQKSTSGASVLVKRPNPNENDDSEPKIEKKLKPSVATKPEAKIEKKEVESREERKQRDNIREEIDEDKPFIFINDAKVEEPSQPLQRVAEEIPNAKTIAEQPDLYSLMMILVGQSKALSEKSQLLFDQAKFLSDKSNFLSEQSKFLAEQSQKFSEQSKTLTEQSQTLSELSKAHNIQLDGLFSQLVTHPILDRRTFS